MNNINKTYRINTKVGETNNDINLSLNIIQNYDVLEILSLKINSENLYNLHTSGYGCVVGRVLANGGVGVPNAKISMFIEADEETVLDNILYELYPYKTVNSKNSERIRYNLLPIEQVSECHQPIGTMPNKRLVLDDKHVLEVFDKYYKYTTVTNESGDYMLFGVPTGNQQFHVDVDMSDIGFLSQKPVDMMYKGYSNSLFENSMQFKTDSNLDNLTQVFTQNSTVYVKPFWGESELEEVGITRNDIDLNYKFEPTCIFIGSLISDDKNSGFSKKCTPMSNMGRMDKLSTGYGTIEMIRKRVDGTVEEYPIKGNELIDSNGVWCYQIPMNLDYVTTDEYGNLVPTDNPEIGIPTRTRVRFRVSLSDFDSDTANNHLVKALIPNNPSEKADYEFGTFTEDNEEGSKSYRDLFWNNVYTVKSYIPRIQKGNYQRTQKFSGIKNVNVNGGNNPIPYNNMRVNLTFMFVLQCAIIKALIRITKLANKIIVGMGLKLKEDNDSKKYRRCLTIGDGLCPDLEGWYFAPGCWDRKGKKTYFTNTLNYINDDNDVDTESIDNKNSESENGICLSNNTDYFMQCVELNLALENDVIQFDFYNDWINGLIYLPRWFVNIRKKYRFFFGGRTIGGRIQACMEDTAEYVRKYTQQCALGYTKGEGNLLTTSNTKIGCHKNGKLHKCHKTQGRKKIDIFGKKNGGIVHKQITRLGGHNVYYVKPCEWNNNKKCLLYATDIVLLGNINKCNIFGIPSEFEGLSTSTFQMPPSIVQTNMDSDGVLYGIKNEGGTSKCSKNKITDGIEKIEQTFENYDTWSKNQEFYELNTDVTEYAVSEMSGIDWGVSGPNQGENDKSKLYFPGGHFLGISCVSAEVNLKSCVNLSRICELGAMISQRQTRVSGYNVQKDGSYNIIYNHIIPTGLISKDEIVDNNFRNIFASLNYNNLKTKVNEYGFREYNFIPLHLTNFRGDLKKYIDNNSLYNKFKWDNNNVPTKSNNADAYTRTIEENSRDYYYFRFGVNEKSNYEDKFLLKENGNLYLPVYENSFYFYFGLKNGSTAIDKFLTEYFAKCPKKGTPKTPSIAVEVTDVIHFVNESGKLIVKLDNIPSPYTYKIFRDGLIVYEGEYYTKEIIFDKNITKGTYDVIIENNMYGISLSTTVKVDETFPSTDEHNLYEDSCLIESEDYIVEPIVLFDTVKKEIEIKPYDNGGIITVKTPMLDNTKKPPYIYGFAVVGDNYAMCKSYQKRSGVENHIINTIKEEYGITYTMISNKNSKEVNNLSDLTEVVDNAIYSYYEDGYVINAFKAWGEDITYTLLLFYGDEDVSDKRYLMEVGSTMPSVSNQTLNLHIYDESVKLTNLDKYYSDNIIKVTSITAEGEKIGELVYDNLNKIDPFEEWAFKKALYYTDSYYNDGKGSIKIGFSGGEYPHTTTVKGDGEKLNDDGKVEVSHRVSDDFSLDINDFMVPTRKWINNNFPSKNAYTYKVVDSNKHTPYILIKDNSACNTTNNNEGTNDNDNPATSIELTDLMN